MKTKLSKTQWVIILAGVYFMCQIIADVTASKMTGPVLGFFVPAAVFIYAVTFTWRDLVHKQLGKKAAVTLIWAAAGVNAVMAGYFALTVGLPPAPFWQNQEAYAMVLGVVPRIVGASILAELVSELIDTEVYHRVSHWAPWKRVLLSNGVSLPIDSVIFVSIAFLGTMPIAALVSVMVGQIIVKAIITVVSTPLIYIVPENPLYSAD